MIITMNPAFSIHTSIGPIPMPTAIQMFLEAKAGESVLAAILEQVCHRFREAGLNACHHAIRFAAKYPPQVVNYARRALDSALEIPSRFKRSTSIDRIALLLTHVQSANVPMAASITFSAKTTPTVKLFLGKVFRFGPDDTVYLHEAMVQKNWNGIPTKLVAKIKVPARLNVQEFSGTVSAWIERIELVPNSK